MSETIQGGTLYIVSTPIGNLDDISRRAIKVLGAVDVIAAEDTRTTKFLLEHLSLKTDLLSNYSYNEKRRLPQLIGKLKEGKSVAVVADAGTPGISDPAFLLIREAIAHGIRTVAIPGASAFLPALIVSGLPTDRFVFEGFLPVKKGRSTMWRNLISEERTIVMYESPFRIEKALGEIVTFLGDRQMALVREITKKFEEVLRGKASAILQHVRSNPPKGEIVLVIAGAPKRRAARGVRMIETLGSEANEPSGEADSNLLF